MPHGLNPAQQRAVETKSGPLLVLAGAGTGKTRVVTFRIAELIRLGVKPERILAVTFTNKAASEMQERIVELLGRKQKQRPEVSTFHSLCVRILRRHITALGYPEKFAIYDQGDQDSTARAVLREIKVPTQSLRPGDLLSMISRWKSASIRPPEAAATAQSDKEHLAAAAYRRYQVALKNAGAVDFDDLLLCVEDLFANFSDIRKAEAGRFDHLLVDEYQDTNASQYRIVRALAGGHQNLCVVGDDDQSIYGWRGAEVAHILRFTKDWPNAGMIRLVQNYRSTAPILEMANRLISYNKTRHDKVLRAERAGGERPRIEQYKDENEEAKSVVADIQRRLTDPTLDPNDFAILFRTNEQPRVFETELRRVDLPYVLVGGMSFFDRKEVRDILAYLKVVDAPEDEVSLRRIINTPPRGLGPKAVETIVERAVQGGKPAWNILADPSAMSGLPASARIGAQHLVELIQMHQSPIQSGKLMEGLKSLIEKVDYEAELRRCYQDPDEQQSRWDAVQEVVNALSRYQQKSRKPTLRGFLDEVLLDRDFGDDKDNQLRRNAIALMTYHSAKGLEFSQVYMVGLEEGILPHKRSVAVEGDAIEEERRLCYVGVTRAQDRLTLSMALARMKWGKPRDTIPSRFLYELTGVAEKATDAGQPKGNKKATAKTTDYRGRSRTKAKKRAKKKVGKRNP